MYEAFYGLREKPFNLTPDPKFLFLSEKHKEALGHLLFGIQNHTGFVMVTGEIGTGKTTICRNLLKQLDTKTDLAYIFNPPLNPVELLRKINSEFGIDDSADNLVDLVDVLNAYLLEASSLGNNCVLLIDEAQNLSPSVLEQIRLLSNLETETEKLLQIVLIGQPELIEMLALKELRQLNQRITARYHLKPLNEKETMQYIAFRIHVAGGRRKVKFAKPAVRAVYQRSGGTPRVINAICDRALLIGYTKEARMITAAVVKRAVREVRGEKPPSEQFWVKAKKHYLPSPSLALAAALVVVLVVQFAPALTGIAQEMRAFNTILTIKDDSAVTESRPTPDAGLQKVEAEIETVALENYLKTLVIAESSVVATKLLPRLIPTPEPVAELPPELSIGEEFRIALAESNSDEMRHAAITALFELWEVVPTDGAPASDAPELLSAYLEAQGMAHEYLTPAIDQLLAVDLPAFVLLHTEDENRWAALLASDGTAFQVTVAPEESYEISREDFLRQYAGEAVIPWRAPTRSKYALTLGLRSDAAARFREHLRDLGRLPQGEFSDVYDKRVASAVAKIQAETGLIVDGMAGKQVRMIVHSWLPNTGTPSLKGDLQEPIESPVETKVLDVPDVAKAILEDAPKELVREVSEEVPAQEMLIDKILPVMPMEAEVEAERVDGDFETTPPPSVTVENIPDPFPDLTLAPANREEYKAVTPSAPGNIPLLPHGARLR